MNPINSAVRKIHNLLSSGAVTVTGPNQPRILKQKIGSTVNNHSGKCYICDESTTGSQNQTLPEMHTTHTNTKFPNKIGQLVGDAFMVIVSVEDVICQRCTNLINYLDRLENDVERVRTNILNLLHKKYGLVDDGTNASQTTTASSPPNKMQKLSGNSVVNRISTANEDSPSDRTRKIVTSATLSDTVGKQSPPVSAVQQIKITTPVQQQQMQQQQIKKAGTKVYKCLSCDFKTTDLKQFNPHYETCKQQNFQCKICKKIFANLAAMKQHMTKEHSNNIQTTTAGNSNDHTCSICHLNFTNDLALKKHTDLNHNTSVVKTAEITQQSTPLYTCNHCQFKSTDKPIFDEHMRKHIGGKPKPFKCRLCSMRFETREQATIHAKQHQPNYFKCATCSVSFPKRELLVKHFEVHQQHKQSSGNAQQQQVQIVQQQQQQPQKQSNSPQIMTTQKLLQDTIDEALSESTAEGDATKSIRFFSCNVCSLTFIQENYFNQHMETHKKGSSMSTSSSGTVVSTAATQALTNSQTTISSRNQGLIRDSGKQRHEAANILISASNVQNSNNSRGNSSDNNNTGSAISDADIESIFEKMHSDKSETDSNAATTAGGKSNSENPATTTAATNSSGENLVITSQESSSGGITFNITIPQPEGSEQNNGEIKSETDCDAGSTPVSVSIDMPVLDQGDDSMTSSKKNTVGSLSSGNNSQINAEDNSKKDENSNRSLGPVSMPSLDDDNEISQDEHQQQQSSDISEQTSDKIKHESQDSQQATTDGGDMQQNSDENSHQMIKSQEEEDHEDSAQQQLTATGDQVSMDLDDMQAGVESGQIKFILNENGQLLQLDNHIITDAEGNQILVQGSDSEQIQQLLQSVGVLQSGDGLDGETLQMIGDNNGQMVIVQGEQGETQLIDASLLNADGHIVIQQSHDGDLSEGGAHVIGEDGTRIPVSVSYTADGQPIVQVQQQHHPHNSDEGDENGGAHKETVSLGEVSPAKTASGETPVTVSQTLTQSSGSNYFALEDLMQQSDSAAKSTD